MNQRVALHELDRLTPPQRERLLSRIEDDLSDYSEKVVPIIDAVRREGDAALVRFAREFDRAEIDAGALAASEQDFERAFDTLDKEFLEVLRYAADNIRRFHQQQLPQPLWMQEIRPGVLVGERHTPIDSVACYSPRGKGSFPSVTLMSTIPAVVAGVPMTIVLTPPGPDGGIDPATLVAARLAGVERVYKAGGAPAVAAAAYGTETVPRCRKIVGAGSPWFVAARRVLAERIDPGFPAGPSESIVLADASAKPEVAALDLIIESEHGDDSSTFLVTWSRELAERAAAAVPEHWQRMSEQRAAYSAAVLGGDSGGIVLASCPQQAYDFINDYAPEHLQIVSKQPFEHINHIRNAGEILLGEYAAGSIANYMMGPNCVLPTGGGAHTRSPLGVHDFLKRQSVGHMTRGGFDEMAPKTALFARYEGFDAHANAVSERRLRLLGE